MKQIYKEANEYMVKNNRMKEMTEDQLKYLQKAYNTGDNVEDLANSAVDAHCGMGDMFSDTKFRLTKHINKVIPKLVKDAEIADSFSTSSIQESSMQYIVYKTVLEILKTNDDIETMEYLQQDMMIAVEKAIDKYNSDSVYVGVLM